MNNWNEKETAEIMIKRLERHIKDNKLKGEELKTANEQLAGLKEILKKYE